MAKSNKNTNINKKHVAHLAKVRRQSMIIRYIAIGIFVLVGGLLLYGFVSQAGFPPYQNVALVNGESVPKSLFVARAKMLEIQLNNQKAQYDQFAQAFGIDPSTDPNMSATYTQITGLLGSKQALGQKVLDTLIDEALIRQEAKKRNITASDAEVTKAMQDAFQYFPNGTPTPAPSATAFVEPTLNPTELAMVTITPTATLAPTATPDLSATPTATLAPTSTNTPGPSPTALPTATPYTEAGFQQQFNTTRSGFAKQTGITDDEFHAIFVNNLLRQKLYDIITAKVGSTEEEVWAQHILVKTEAEAKTVEDRLKAGEDWNKVAADVSIDTSNKDNGGDLGWFGRGAMVKEFEDAAFSLKVGETSQPVKSQFGYHIIRVLGHENRPVSATQVQSLKDSAFNTWLTDARTAAKIKTYAFWQNLDLALPTQTSP